MSKVALITGITGQDGSYLAELLLSKGYHVHGLIRRSSTFNGSTARVGNLYANPFTHNSDEYFNLHYVDFRDSYSLVKLLDEIQPTEVYHLAAQSHVQISFEMVEYSAEVNAVDTTRLLEAIRTCGLINKTKFFNSSTAEMFGKATEIPQNEKTRFCPRSPYAIAKLYSYWMVVNYRESYNMNAYNGILYNHESPHENFVTRKITKSVAKISLGFQDHLELGNISSSCDWGHAREYVEAMWRMLQQETPDDYIVATGKCTTVRKFVELAFEEVGIRLVWQGEGHEEVGIDEKSGAVRVKINPKFYRPTNPSILVGDASKAFKTLDWKPKKQLKDIIHEMVHYDIRELKSRKTG